MIVFVYYLQRQLQRQQLLLIALLLQLSPMQRNFDVSAQWITVAEFSMRVPGRCTVVSGTSSNSKNWRRQQFDCDGSKLLPQQQRRCIPLQHFHDGIVDCPDGSDEFCFPGYIKCGSYCVSLQYAAQCFINPRCDNSPTSPQFCDVTKKKLCSIEGTVPCKGFGECVMRKWIENGETNCIDKSDEDLAYIAVFGIRRGANPYPGLQFGSNTSEDFRDMISSTQRIISPWLQSISPSPSYLSSTNDTDYDSISYITEEWNNATIQSTTEQFVFQIPNNDLNVKDFNSPDFDITTVGFTNKAEIVNDSIQVNHQVQQNSQNVVPNNGQQHSSNTFQNFTMRIGSNQAGHNDSNNSTTITTTYQLHLTTVKPSTVNFFTANPSTTMQQSSFIYRPAENSTQKIARKLENSVRTSTNSASSHNVEKLYGNRYNELLSSAAKSSSTIRTDNDNNKLEYSGTVKQDNVIISNDISLSSPSSNQPQNQNGTINPSANSISNSAKDTAIIPMEPQQISPAIIPNQQPEENNINTPQNDNFTNIIISTTSNPSPDQMACARYEYAEAQRLVPKPSCTCPPGQMPNGEHAVCKTTIVSTFGIDVHNMCGGMETDPEERPRLAILVLNRTRLPYQACVRQIGHLITVQLNCSQCTTTEFDDAFKRNSNDQYVPLRIMELPLGACFTSTLNDCDPEHADCLVDGPRYECRCHDGWNDTSKELGQPEGRRCEQLILHAEGCTLFLGYCLLWWFISLGIILFLIIASLCWLGYILYKWCQKRRRRNVVEEQGHLVTSEVGSIKNSNPKLAVTESINMNNNPSSIGSISTTDGEKEVSTADTRYITDSIQSDNQNVSKAATKVLIKQQSVKSLDQPHKNDKAKEDEKQQQSEISEQNFFDEPKFERKANEQKTSANSIANADSVASSQKKLKKTASEAQTESSEVSAESQKSTNVMLSQKDSELLLKDGKVMKSLENVESTNPKVMNVSQSLSETSLRTMWELFKQGTWKQSSRPSSIKSSTPSLDRLIDVFLCRKRSEKILPIAITTSNSTEYPLDTVKIVDLGVDDTHQPSNTTFTTFTCCSTIATTSTITTATSDAISSANGMAQLFTAEAPMKTEVLEQKIVTETKTLTTRSTISLLPGEIAIATVQSPNSIIPTVDRSEFVQSDQQPVSDMASIAGNEIPQQDAITTIKVQHSAIEENTIVAQEPSTTIQTKNETKDQVNNKPSTTTVITSSDTKLKRWTNTISPDFSELRKTQSEHGRRLTMTQNDDMKEKTLPTADELRNALKEVASTKPPTKRLTEKQREKLSASCGHLHIQGDDERGRKAGGSIGQLLATTRHEPRRKLSSISEKSIEMMNGGNQLISVPSSISCPTTTRISKGFIAALERNFNPLNDDCSTLEQNRISTKMRRKTDSDISGWRQRPISIVDSRPPWNSSPLKDGDLDRIAPLQPGFLHSYQSRKWLSALHLDDERATTSRQNRRNISGHRQSDWNLHDVSHAHMIPASHSARLHTRLPSAKVLRNSGGVKWTPNGTEDHSKPVKEQLWWDAH